MNSTTAALPKIISRKLLVAILFLLHCMITDMTDLGSMISLVHHKTFSIRSPPILRLWFYIV